jgi:CRP-like cAMP-binding protein
MENTLVEMMSNFIDLTNDEKQGILETFPIKTILKESFLLKEGQISKDAFVVIKGCIRKYYLQEGEEITTQFYTEFQSAADIESMANQSPSKYYLICSEDTTVAIMNSEKENALYKKFPRFAEVCRVQMEKVLGANQEAMSTFVHSTPKERYLNLMENRPDLIQRVPQYQLASYLGIKPETLSRIRNRVSLND